MNIEGLNKNQSSRDDGVFISKETIAEISNIIGLPKTDNSSRKKDINKCDKHLSELANLKGKIQAAIVQLEEQIDEHKEIQRNLQRKIEAKLEEE